MKCFIPVILTVRVIFSPVRISDGYRLYNVFDGHAFGIDRTKYADFFVPFFF